MHKIIHTCLISFILLSTYETLHMICTKKVLPQYVHVQTLPSACFVVSLIVNVTNTKIQQALMAHGVDWPQYCFVQSTGKLMQKNFL